ncbi:MAG: histidine phosphatase family protein, partial [Pseudomonadota bacterium]
HESALRFEHADHEQPIIAVTSAGVISTMVADLLGYDLAWQRRQNVALYNASVTELVGSPTMGWRLQRFNSIDHLPNPTQHTLA